MEPCLLPSVIPFLFPLFPLPSIYRVAQKIGTIFCTPQLFQLLTDFHNYFTVKTTHFQKLTTGSNVFIVSVIVYSNCHPAVFTSNVQCVCLAAGRRTQASDATDQ